MRVLDCGCGGGSITVGLADAVGKGFVIGVDRSARMVSVARALARTRATTNVFFEKQNIERLEFVDETFDIVFAHSVLDHVAEPELAIAEMLRVLRPGGLLALRSANWSRAELQPPSRQAYACLKLYQRQIADAGSNPHISGRFEAMLSAHELRQIHRGNTTEAHRNNLPLAAALTRAMTSAGMAMSEDVARLTAHFTSWAQGGGSTFIEHWVETLDEKPAAR